LTCILGVLKHEQVSSDFYTIRTRVLHDQCLLGYYQSNHSLAEAWASVAGGTCPPGFSYIWYGTDIVDIRGLIVIFFGLFSLVPLPPEEA